MATHPDPEQAYRALRAAASKFIDLGEAEWLLLRGAFKPMRAASSVHLTLRAGELAPVLFVAEGLLRAYQAAGDGSISKTFLSEGMFSPLPEGCSMPSAGGCGAEALEPSLVLMAEGAAWNALYDSHPVFDRLGRKLAAFWLARKESQASAFQLHDARERYLGFARLNPDLMQRVPQYHIASYLGITGVSLSRIRRALARDRAFPG